MDAVEVTIKGEIFRISEHIRPDGQTSYHFSWLNGPADGSYGFTVGQFGMGSESAAGTTPLMTPEQLISEAQGFITEFYKPGGIGEQDFPGHSPAQPQGRDAC